MLVGCRCNSNYTDASVDCDWEPLSSDKYNLYRAWSLTKAGTLLFNITGEDLSLEAEYAPQICKTCYRRLNTIAKLERRRSYHVSV